MIYEKLMDITNETTVNLVGTRIESIKRTDITRTTYRAYYNGYIGVAGSIGLCDELELRKLSNHALKKKIIYPCEPSKEKEEKFISTSVINSEDKFLNEVECLVDELKSKYTNFALSNRIGMIRRETHIQNDCGLDLYSRVNYFSVKLLFKERESKSIFDGKIFYKDKEFDKGKLSIWCNEVFTAYKNEVSLPLANEYAVVFNALDFFPIKKLIGDLHGYRFGSGNSVLSGKLGKKVFDGKFTFRQSHNPLDSYEPFFDVEGVVSNGNQFTLVSNGVIISPYTDKKTSKIFNLPLTGSAVADYDSVPTPGLTTFKLGEFNKNIKELLGNRKGIIVIDASGGGVTVEGDFNLSVQLAMLFDDGKLIGRLPQLKICSDYYTIFGSDFVGVGKNDLFPTSREEFIVLNIKASNIVCIK